MVKQKEEELWNHKIIPYPHKGEQIEGYVKWYELSSGNKKITFEVNTRTSSCGSIQLLYLANDGFGYHGFNKTSVSKEIRQKIFDEIKSTYGDHNNIFFIDKDGGLLEKFFADLGFTKVWDYGNTNTWNIVNIWCYNKLTKEEVEELEEQEDRYEDDDW